MSSEAVEKALNDYYQAAAALAEAETWWASAWVRFKNGIKGCTDAQAQAMADAETECAVTLKAAVVEVAHHRLEDALQEAQVARFRELQGGD